MISALNYVIKMIKSSQVDSDGSISSWVNEISWNCALQVDEPPVLLRLITTTRCRELQKILLQKLLLIEAQMDPCFFLI